MAFPAYKEGVFRKINLKISVPRRAVEEAAEVGTNEEELK